MKLREPVFLRVEQRRGRREAEQRHRCVFAVADFRPLLDDVLFRISFETERDKKWIRRVFQFDARERDVRINRGRFVAHVNQIRRSVAVGVSGLQRRLGNETVAELRMKLGFARQ